VAGLRSPALVDYGAKYALLPDYPVVAAANIYYGKIY
jgi:hypothetical protein